MRKTMHLIATEDAGWLLPLFEPEIAKWSRRRLGQLGMPASTQERALAVIESALESDGPLAREDLAARLERSEIALDQRTRTHVFLLATVSGIACLGPDIAGSAGLAPRRDWLGSMPRHDRDAALKELARRYLGAFAPVTEADFAGWSGLGLRDVRDALAGIGNELAELRLGDERAWRLKRRSRRAGGRIVRLLPAYDTYLMGHRDRDFIAAGERWRRIAPGGGILRPAIVVDGVAVGTWRTKRSGRTTRVKLEPFAKLDRATLKAIEDEVADIGRFEATEATLAGAE
jgi:hypothetical protein